MKDECEAFLEIWEEASQAEEEERSAAEDKAREERGRPTLREQALLDGERLEEEDSGAQRQRAIELEEENNLSVPYTRMIQYAPDPCKRWTES